MNPGDRIGRYKLLQELGEGGCGVVYVAEQLEPVRRRVALKIVKLGMDTKQVIARFEAERQALALMDHPNIAKVLDAGATETGRPFFVMELVRGIRITDYCDQNKLTMGERLKLFLQVCQAIQHAHQRGIVHRDIKPSNILVTLHDGVPVSKIIDFGIAKATNNQVLTDKTIYTAFEQFIGTPAYMSPEQAEMSGLEIDGRSDVYSLGVLLYELLTGKTPFDAEALLRSGVDRMRQIIREEEPPRPSTRLQTLTSLELADVANRRQAEPPKLLSLVRGDLDWVVMKCLEKDRTRRYGAAQGLTEDVQRHLEHKPVTARPPGRSYRMMKFARRNKTSLTVAGAIGVILGLMVGVSILLWTREHVSRQRVLEVEKAQERFRAETEVQNLLDQAANHRNQNRQQDYIKALEQSLQPARVAYGEKHATTVGIMLDLAGEYSRVGRMTNALEFFQQSLAAQEATLPTNDPAILRTRWRVGWCYVALNQRPEGIRLMEEVLRLQTTTPGINPEDAYWTMGDLASACLDAGRFADAIPLFERAFTLVPRDRSDDHNQWMARRLIDASFQVGNLTNAFAVYRERLVPLDTNAYRTLPTASLLGGIPNISWLCFRYKEAGHAEEGLKLLNQALELCRSNYGQTHPETLGMMEEFAKGLWNSGMGSNAVVLDQQCLALREAALPPGHPDILRSRWELGQWYTWSDRPADGVRLLEGVLKRQREQLGMSHTNTLTTMETLAYAYSYMKRPAEALALFQEALAVKESKLPKDYRDILRTQNNIGWYYRTLNRPGDAALLLEEVVRRGTAILGTNDTVTHLAMGGLACSYLDTGRVREAIPLFENDLAFKKVNLGRAHNDTQWLARQLINAYAQADRLLEAIVVYKDVLAPSDTNAYRSLASSALLASPIQAASDGLRQAGRTNEAVQVIEKASELSNVEFGETHIETLAMMDELARVYEDAGLAAKAIKVRKNCLAVRKSNSPMDHLGVIRSLHLLGNTLAHQGRFAEAEAMQREALKMRRETSDSGEPSIVWILNNLAWALRDQGKLAEAERMQREAVESVRQTSDAVSLTAATFFTGLADICDRQNKYSEAETNFYAGLAIQRKLLGNENLAVAATLRGLGNTLSHQGRYAGAEARQREALAIRRKSPDGGEPSLALILDNLAWSLREQGKLAEAIPIQREALAIQRTTLGSEHRDVGRSLGSLAWMLRDQGQLAEAETAGREALQIAKKTEGPEHADVANRLGALGYVLELESKLAEAEAIYREAFVVQRKVLGDSDNSVTETLKHLANVMLAERRFAEGDKFFDELLPANTEYELKYAGQLEARGNYRARRGQWRAAASDLGSVARLVPGNSYNRMRLVPLLIQNGESARSREQCQEMLARFGTTKDRWISEQTAKACLVLPPTDKDLEAAGRLADQAVALDGQNRWMQFVKGLAEHRRGRFEEAAAWMEKVLANTGQSHHLQMESLAVLAMAQHQLSQAGEARKTLTRAGEIAAARMPKSEDGDLGDAWQDWLIARLLQREARSLIENKPATPEPAK